MTTVHTLEFGLALAVFFRAMPALRTSPTCVARVNERERDAGELSLVSDELPKLEERPAGNLRALRLPEPFLDALADAFQILKSYPALSAYGRGNEFLADAMVSVRAKVGLLPALTFEQPPDGAWTLARLRLFGSLVLQRLTERVTPLTHPLDFRA